jgi:8-oxo-dGTP pyrophosphatase MutT (NUDIX family)
MTDITILPTAAPTRRIRPIAIGIFRQGGRIFVAEGRDPLSGRRFYRPLGGGIEFGESGAEALARELREEITAEISDMRYLTLIENRFSYNGEPGHEIVLVYEARFADPRFYTRETIAGVEGVGTDNPEAFLAVWKPLASFTPAVPLYPEGLLDLLKGTP